MKVRGIILTSLTLVSFSGTIAPSQIKTNDTLAATIDSAGRRVANMIVEGQISALDSLKYVLDSIIQERGKRLVIKDIDSFKTVNGKTIIWEWAFWEYPNGNAVFYKPIIRTR